MAWESKIGQVECSEVSPTPILLNLEVQYKIEVLMKTYPSTEWLGYLTGAQTKTCALTDDLLIPPHKEVSTGSAEAEPLNVPANCIGVIHSHHSMGAFHSGTDQAYVDRNFPYSITVAKRNSNLEFETMACIKTPCGKYCIKRGTLKLEEYTPKFEIKHWLAKARKNIEGGILNKIAPYVKSVVNEDEWKRVFGEF